MAAIGRVVLVAVMQVMYIAVRKGVGVNRNVKRIMG
jgi:hypothetical protein